MAVRIKGSRWVLVVSAIAAVTAFASPAAAVVPPQPLEYVNLGDSFSAGSGVSPAAATHVAICSQSEQNFSHVVSQQLGYRLTDVSCGGATTEHFYSPQYENTLPQLDALTPTTELVTVMIGGNNNNTFVGAMAACVAAMITHPRAFDPCRMQYGNALTEPIETQTYPALVRALRDVHERSPRAEVVIAGYPWLLPAGGSCSPQMPIADGDVPYLRELQAKLNDAIRRAAQETGTAFADMSVVSEGRDGCQPVGERWVEPMLFSRQPVPVHPNAEGERALAAEVLKAIASK